MDLLQRADQKSRVCTGSCQWHSLPGRPEFPQQVMADRDQQSNRSGDLHCYRYCLVRSQSKGGAGWWPIPLQLLSNRF